MSTQNIMKNNRNMKNTIKTVIWCLAGLFVVYTFYFLWKQSQPEPEVYELVSPQKRDIQKTTVATGKLLARREVSVKPQITGVITKVLVKPGDRVIPGQEVAHIRVIPDMSQLNNAQSAIESARIKLEEQQREWERAKRLYEKGVVSTEEYQQYETRLKTAREELTSAKAAYEVVTKGSSMRSGTINTTIVTSPISGLVLNVPVKEGSSVSATSMFSDGTTVCTVADMSDVLFKGNIDETEVARLRVGMPTTLVLGAMQDIKVPATLEYISPEGVEQNGVTKFEVWAAVNIPEGIDVRSGYSVNARIVTEEHKGALSIDEASVVFDADSAYVYRLTSSPEDLSSQEWERIPVKVGMSNGIYVEILQGVNAGDHLRGIKK